MDKKFFFVAIALAALIIIQFAVNLFVINPKLRESARRLEQAQEQLDKARTEIGNARSKVDSISIAVLKFSNYLVSIQSNTEMLVKDRELREARFKAQRDSIMSNVERLKSKLDTIALPNLTLYDSRKN